MLRSGVSHACLVLLLSGVLAGCARPLSKAEQGTAAGAALGAGAGAIIGSMTGHAGAGTAIGAGIGALGGAIAGNSLDQVDKQNEELNAQVSRNQQLLDENKRLIDELRKRGADVHSSKRGVVINLPDILFEFDRSELTREAKRTVGEISEVLAGVKHRALSIEGHTDSVGSVKYNKELSLRRATSVAGELGRRGIARNRITIEGYGEGDPIASNNSEAGRARNRRVEIIIEN